jgi:hypothetical protein
MFHRLPAANLRTRPGGLDRYAGCVRLEQPRGYRFSAEAIKPYMIRLADEDIQEDAVIRPGLRYAIFKITNGSMTAPQGQ